MNRGRATAIPQRIVAWLLAGVSQLHPTLRYHNEPDVRAYWRSLPNDKQTAKTGTLLALHPFLEYGTLLAVWVAVFVGPFWLFAALAVTTRWLRLNYETYYLLSISQQSGSYEREYPELFAEHEVSTRVTDLTGRSAAMVTRFRGVDYLLIDPEMLRSHAPVEIEPTLAHEIGHCALDHLRRKMVVSWLAWLPVAAMFWVTVQNPSLWSVGGLLGVLLTVRLVREWRSRQQEYAADRFAVELTGDPLLVSRWLYRLQYAGLRPEGVLGELRVLFSTHPRTNERYERIRGLLRADESGEAAD